MTDAPKSAHMDTSPTHPERIRYSPLCPLCGGTSTILYDKLRDRLFDAPGEWQLLICTNQQCGLAWICPMPTPKLLAQAYENYYTHNVSRSDSWLRRRYERFRNSYIARRFNYKNSAFTLWDKLGGSILACLPHRRAAFDASVMWLPAKPGGTVLEIGCGNGELLSRLEALGWTVQGVEPDPKSAAIAHTRGLPVTVGELTEHMFQPDAFDAIIMSHVIEHVRAPISLLAICRRCLKPGGRLVILTPNLASLGHRWFSSNWLHLDPPRHLQLFTQGSIALACRQAGFKDVNSTYTLRDANWTLAGSAMLGQNRQYRLGSLSLMMKILGLVLLYLEWLHLLFNRQGGEELLTVARKG